jgi:2-dehydro-3-deoxyglucarate aldolase
METSQPANDLAAILDDGDAALGILDNTYSPTLVEFYGELDLDFVWLDLEHGGPDPWDWSQLEDLLRAAERTDIELLVRLPDTDPTLVRKALDLGVRNVFLPRVETAEEVRDAVRSARFVTMMAPAIGVLGRHGLVAGVWPTITSPPKTERPSSV